MPQQKNQSLARKLLPRILKAVVKSVIVLILFLVFSQFLAPVEQIYPQAMTLVETYVLVYIVFVVAGELTKDTIYRYVLNVGKAFFFIGYSIYALNNGTITASVAPVTFSVNLQAFLMMIIVIGTMDFAKSLMQIINYMSDKAETQEIMVILPEQEIPAE